MVGKNKRDKSKGVTWRQNRWTQLSPRVPNDAHVMMPIQSLACQYTTHISGGFQEILLLHNMSILFLLFLDIFPSLEILKNVIFPREQCY